LGKLECIVGERNNFAFKKCGLSARCFIGAILKRCHSFIHSFISTTGSEIANATAAAAAVSYSVLRTTWLRHCRRQLCRWCVLWQSRHNVCDAVLQTERCGHGTSCCCWCCMPATKRVQTLNVYMMTYSRRAATTGSSDQLATRLIH
jgi:hypothetical protein